MTLRSRVVLIVTTLVVCGITAASFLAYDSTQRELVEQTDLFLEERAEELTDGTRDKPSRSESGRDDQGTDGQSNDDRNGGDSDDDESIVSELSFDPDAIVQTLDGDGTVLASSGAALPVSEKDIEVSGGGRDQFRNIEIDGTEYRMITVNADLDDGEGGGGDGAVQVATETAASDDVLSRLRWRLAAIGVTLAAVAALLGWVLMRRTTRPLEDVTAAAERVASSSDLTPLRGLEGTDRNDEVGRLAASFDQMLAALALSRAQQRRLVQDAAHELRTPLTSLRTNVELLQRAPNLPPDEHTALMNGLASEVTELGDLFGELIQLATDPTVEPNAHVHLDVSEVIDGAVERFRIRTGRTVDVRTEPTPLDGDPIGIERAITNLLSNADKFSASDAPIEVELVDGRVTVSDHGPGIPADERDAVFDRFFRSESARSTPGSGLGLAIVRQVAEHHGGTAFVGSAADGGAVVGFTLGRG